MLKNCTTFFGVFCNRFQLNLGGTLCFRLILEVYFALNYFALCTGDESYKFFTCAKVRKMGRVWGSIGG